MSNYFVAPDDESGELTLYEGTPGDSHRIIGRKDFPTEAEFRSFAMGAMLLAGATTRPIDAYVASYIECSAARIDTNARHGGHAGLVAEVEGLVEEIGPSAAVDRIWDIDLTQGHLAVASALREIAKGMTA